jgi:hypothetical protein
VPQLNLNGKLLPKLSVGNFETLEKTRERLFADTKLLCRVWAKTPADRQFVRFSIEGLSGRSRSGFPLDASRYLS